MSNNLENILSVETDDEVTAITRIYSKSIIIASNHSIVSPCKNNWLLPVASDRLRASGSRGKVPGCFGLHGEVSVYICLVLYMSHYMIFPTMWYVRPAKPQISLRIRAV